MDTPQISNSATNKKFLINFYKSYKKIEYGSVCRD